MELVAVGTVGIRAITASWRRGFVASWCVVIAGGRRACLPFAARFEAGCTIRVLTNHDLTGACS